MKENQFIHARADSWESFERVLDEFESAGSKQLSVKVETFVSLYRSVSNDLSIARTRLYGANLIDRLNSLVLRGHNAVYLTRIGWLEKIYRFYAIEFPNEVRKHKKPVLASIMFFVLPWLVVTYCISQSDTFIYTIMEPEIVNLIEQMYDSSAESQRQGPNASNKIQAFGHYLFNNTSIGLVTFVSGIGLGLLTVFVLLFNSVFLGAVFAHLSFNGYGSALYPFVIGHGAFELTAIVIAGAAGLRLASAIYFPGDLGRKTALRQGIREVMTLVAGFFTMFIVAAFIEAFWSSSALPAIIKYVVGGILWVLVLSYFYFAGRNEISRLPS